MTNEGKMPQTIETLLRINEGHSREFLNQKVERERYRGEHPTEIAALKCMDGRLHLPNMTETALGIIQPFRNIGGIFNLGWPHFQVVMYDWVKYASSRGRHALVMVTYHYSRGEKLRGCAGFKYSTDAAVDAAQKLKQQFDRVYGIGLHKLVCGIETDLESLVLHGERGQIFDLAECTDTSVAGLSVMLTRLYPSFPERVILDLLPLVEGNIRHVQKVRNSNRPVRDSEHKEWVLGVGRGFDWLHLMNTAFIVGPYNPDLADPIGIAGKLLSKNFQEGRVSEKNMVLLTSAGYRSPGPEQKQAEEKSRYLTDFSLQVLKEQVPDLLDHLQVLTATVDFETRKLDILSRVEKASELFREMVSVA